MGSKLLNVLRPNTLTSSLFFSQNGFLLHQEYINRTFTKLSTYKNTLKFDFKHCILLKQREYQHSNVHLVNLSNLQARDVYRI